MVSVPNWKSIVTCVPTVGVIISVSFLFGVLIAYIRPYALDKAVPYRADFLALLGNNSVAWLVVLLGGFALSVPTFLVIVINFAEIGWCIAQYVSQHEYLHVFTAVAPHALFECISIYIASCVSLLIAREELKLWRTEGLGSGFFNFLQKTVTRWMQPVIVSWLFLFIGAYIETYISYR